MTSMKRFATAAFATLAITACSSAFNDADTPITVAERHPITVDSQVVTLNLEAPDEGRGLSETDRARVAAFAQSYLVRGHGPVTVTAPSTGPGYLDAEQIAGDARVALHEAGVSWTDIRGASYVGSSSENSGIVTLSFTRYVAEASKCGAWTDSFASKFQNRPSPNLGCAIQSNLAALVADPRDLVEPSAIDPVDAAFRTRGTILFRQGEDSTSQRNPEVNTTTGN